MDDPLQGPLLIRPAMNVNYQSVRELRWNLEKLTTGAFVGVATLSDVRPHTARDWGNENDNLFAPESAGAIIFCVSYDSIPRRD